MPELSEAAIEHKAQVANVLTAHPSQSMSYGQRDPKQNVASSMKSIQRESQASSTLLYKS